MLVAYGPENQPIVAEDAPLEQIQHLSHEQLLHCPNCRGIVHVRGGPKKRTQLHFAHRKGECAWSTESESPRHARGKLVLAHWLQQQFPRAQVTLEERLPEPSRIADIFVKHPDGRQWAVEFQCAPLDIEEWQLRHTAYRKAGILDTWIIGNNRREKQEAFIEAILATTREILFLDPLVEPPDSWLRWSITRRQALEWQKTNKPDKIANQSRQAILPSNRPELGGWVGHTGYGMTLFDSLSHIRLDPQGKLLHPQRTAMEEQRRLLQAMTNAQAPEETQLYTYLQPYVEEKALQHFIIPLLKSYLHDPELMKRYNYGRGQASPSPDTANDPRRIARARVWLSQLQAQGYTTADLQALIKTIPFVGPYAAFAGYAEMLLALLSVQQ
jgi:Competence protein CoiA-like family